MRCLADPLPPCPDGTPPPRHGDSLAPELDAMLIHRPIDPLAWRPADPLTRMLQNEGVQRRGSEPSRARPVSAEPDQRGRQLGHGREMRGEKGYKAVGKEAQEHWLWEEGGRESCEEAGKESCVEGKESCLAQFTP
uniref:Uncharacterized protein n=1 Tax=Sphaerodactylus townsendi TaxID=933632 RepID=A0ACB8G9G1_9SAUR